MAPNPFDSASAVSVTPAAGAGSMPQGLDACAWYSPIANGLDGEWWSIPSMFVAPSTCQELRCRHARQSETSSACPKYTSHSMEGSADCLCFPVTVWLQL